MLRLIRFEVGLRGLAPLAGSEVSAFRICCGVKENDVCLPCETRGACRAAVNTGGRDAVQKRGSGKRVAHLEGSPFGFWGFEHLQYLLLLRKSGR
jgi:hypothetical protein